MLREKTEARGKLCALESQVLRCGGVELHLTFLVLQFKCEVHFSLDNNPSNRMGGGKRNGARYSRNRSRPLESIKDGECGTEQMAEKKEEKRTLYSHQFSFSWRRRIKRSI